MENRIKMCLELNNRISNYQKFIKSIIKSDNTWLFVYDPKISIIIVMTLRRYTSFKKYQKMLKSRFITKPPNLNEHYQ